MSPAWETLEAIASRYYQNPSTWRHRDANGIDDPLVLESGVELHIRRNLS
jgi:hypothetical protein